MTLVVLLILAVVWSLYLASFLRNQARTCSANSISSFTKHLEVLDRARPAGYGHVGLASSSGVPLIRAAAPAHRPDPLVRSPKVRGLTGGAPITVEDARRRRVEILRLLALTAVLSVVPAVAFGGAFLYVTAAAWTVFAGYVLLLVRAQKLAQERAGKVHYLHGDEWYGEEWYEDDDAEYDAWYDEDDEPLLRRTAR